MATTDSTPVDESLEREERRFNTGGILLGIGFGGFVDGIVLHQLLQWHHMLTSTGDTPQRQSLDSRRTRSGTASSTSPPGSPPFVGIFVLTQAMRAGYRATARHSSDC